MSNRQYKNIPASVRQRLLNKARAEHRPFNELLVYFAMERFLYRLSQSRHADRFVLKGALMLTAWEAPLSRPTRDIDLLGFADNDLDTIVAKVREVCDQVVETDGIEFDTNSVRGDRIKEDADYEGVRVIFDATLDAAKVKMQIDIAFGDVVVPQPVVIDYPTLLDLPAPRLRGYTMESAVAEKFEAAVRLDLVNSRMKDFYDIQFLARNFPFEGSILTEAVRRTFENRGTNLTSRPTLFTDRFAKDDQLTKRWSAFVNRFRSSDQTLEFIDLMDRIHRFLGPITDAVANGRDFALTWPPGGPWEGP